MNFVGELTLNSFLSVLFDPLATRFDKKNKEHFGQGNFKHPAGPGVVNNIASGNDDSQEWSYV